MGEAHQHSEMLFPALFCRHQKQAVKKTKKAGRETKAITTVWEPANNKQDTIRSKTKTTASRTAQFWRDPLFHRKISSEDKLLSAPRSINKT